MKKILPLHAIVLPENAKRVFKGQIFDVYQWPQVLFDGSTATFEMLKRPDTVQIIAVKDNKIVMVNDEQPNRSAELHFPGGRADEEGENWLEAAKRELQEETGFTFKNWKLVAVYQPLMKIEHFAVWFVATDFQSEQAQNLDAGERIIVELHDFQAIKDYIMSDSIGRMSYALDLFEHTDSIEDVLELAEFVGQEVDR